MINQVFRNRKTLVKAYQKTFCCWDVIYKLMKYVISENNCRKNNFFIVVNNGYICFIFLILHLFMWYIFINLKITILRYLISITNFHLDFCENMNSIKSILSVLRRKSRYFPCRKIINQEARENMYLQLSTRNKIESIFYKNNYSLYGKTLNSTNSISC